MGDSFFFGEALNAEERITEQLQRLTGDALEIVNVSAPGYGTGQEYLFINELIGRGYEVGDMLVFTFFANDVLDNSGLGYADGRRVPRVPAFRVDEEGNLVSEPSVKPVPPEPTPAEPKPLAQRVAGWFRNRAFMYFLRHRAESLAGRHPWIVSLAGRCGADVVPNRTPAIIVGWYTEGWEERWSTTEDVLSYVTREGRFGATEVVVMYVPSSLQVEPSIRVLVERFSDHDPRYLGFLDDPDRPQRALREFCAENGVSLFDTTPALKKASLENPVYYLREGHLNPFGTEQVAVELYRWLVARGDVTDPGTSPGRG